MYLFITASRAQINIEEEREREREREREASGHLGNSSSHRVFHARSLLFELYLLPLICTYSLLVRICYTPFVVFLYRANTLRLLPRLL